MIKKILVPIAFTQYSRGILNYAAELAAATGAEMLVVNVINERDLQAVHKITAYGYKVDVEKYISTIKKERREGFNEMIGALALPDDKVNFSFCVGVPAEELLKVVIGEKVDMVVMGVKAHNLSELFAGSVAEQLFRRCPATVVFYRDEENARRLRKKIEKHLKD